MRYEARVKDARDGHWMVVLVDGDDVTEDSDGHTRESAEEEARVLNHLMSERGWR
jgi:predicted RNase H-like HicB family nuclease